MRTASQVMRPASQAHHPSSQRMRAAVYDPDAPGADEASADADDAISDYTWKIERRGGRAAKVLGSLVAAAAAAVALASWQGWIDVGLFEPTVQEASAASEEVDGPAVAVGSPTAVPAPGADLTATSPRPSAAVTALADSPATGAAPQARSSRPRRAVAPTREERRRDEPRPWTEARARPAEGAAPAEEEVAPVIAPTAPAIAPTAPAGNDVALAAPQPAPAPAAPLAEVKQTPVSVGSSASVDRLIRDYRDVGQSISHLQARGGDEAARRLRDRYFRLPYGDALRIPAVRRDALAELAGLRREVEAAIESLASQPNG
jgi:hypothetical protein